MTAHTFRKHDHEHPRHLRPLPHRRISGEADFSHLGDLLDFTPVPRKTKRFDGWNEERQRAFIAALAATGSKRKAARSIGRAVFRRGPAAEGGGQRKLPAGL